MTSMLLRAVAIDDPATAAVLARLAMAAPAPVNESALAALLGHHQVEQLLEGLRDYLAAVAEQLPGGGAPSVVVHEGNTWQLRLPAQAIDVLRFLALADGAVRAQRAGDGEEAGRLARLALALWRREFGSGEQLPTALRALLRSARADVERLLGGGAGPGGSASAGTTGTAATTGGGATSGAVASGGATGGAAATGGASVADAGGGGTAATGATATPGTTAAGAGTSGAAATGGGAPAGTTGATDGATALPGAGSTGSTGSAAAVPTTGPAASTTPTAVPGAGAAATDPVAQPGTRLTGAPAPQPPPTGSAAAPTAAPDTATPATGQPATTPAPGGPTGPATAASGAGTPVTADPTTGQPAPPATPPGTPAAAVTPAVPPTVAAPAAPTGVLALFPLRVLDDPGAEALLTSLPPRVPVEAVGPPPEGPAAPTAWADLARDTAARAGHERVVVLARGAGVLGALALAREHPEILARMVLDPGMTPAIDVVPRDPAARLMVTGASLALAAGVAASESERRLGKRRPPPQRGRLRDLLRKIFGTDLQAAIGSMTAMVLDRGGRDSTELADELAGLFTTPQRAGPSAVGPWIDEAIEDATEQA